MPRACGWWVARSVGRSGDAGIGAARHGRGRDFCKHIDLQLRLVWAIRKNSFTECVFMQWMGFSPAAIHRLKRATSSRDIPPRAQLHSSRLPPPAFPPAADFFPRTARTTGVRFDRSPTPRLSNTGPVSRGAPFRSVPAADRTAAPGCFLLFRCRSARGCHASRPATVQVVGFSHKIFQSFSFFACR